MKNLYLSLLLLLALTTQKVFAQTPVLNSYPSASATALLDFDGHYVDGTAWNYSGPITCGPANMTPAQITEVFHRIAEDYRPFNINVTTDSAKYWAAPATQRTRIVFTVTSEWYGAAGGVAYINSFSWGDHSPAFVFSALLGYSPKWVAEAGAHELGHTLGLRHQSSYDGNCVKTAEYNSGTGSGEIAWAPIMGVGYYRNFTLWNNGANPYGCTSYQDDLGIITSADNGFGFRNDDYSAGLNGSATPMTANGGQLTASGVIERITDQDAFRFSVSQTTNFRLNALPFSAGAGNAGSNLDLEVQLYTTGQTLLATYNPSNMLHVVVDTVLAPGNYWIRVQGRGNQFAPEYASLGSYNLRATLGGWALPLRRLELKGLAQDGRHRLSWIVDADETVVRQTLEASANGRDYHPVADVQATDRQYQHLPSAATASYRLNVTFDDGRQYYSNVVMLRSERDSRPQLLSAGGAAVTVAAPMTGSYTLLDYSGRRLSGGKLTEGVNTIATGGLTSGIYLLRFENGAGISTEKFMKK